MREASPDIRALAGATGNYLPIRTITVRYRLADGGPDEHHSHGTGPDTAVSTVKPTRCRRHMELGDW